MNSWKKNYAAINHWTAKQSTSYVTYYRDKFNVIGQVDEMCSLYGVNYRTN